MFQFSGFAHFCDYSSSSQVSPFGNLRINSYLLIPGAYRSLSRPSSPLRAKASPVYPFLLSSTRAPFAPHGMLFLIPVASLESGAKNQESRPKSFLIFLFSFIFRALTVLFCCLLFQFTSSNMSKNVPLNPLKGTLSFSLPL